MNYDVEFDFSDAPPIDGVREVLDVAVSVLRDYSPNFGNTRIERMARWLILNLGADVMLEHYGARSVAACTPSVAVTCVGDKIVFEVQAVLRNPLTRSFGRDEAVDIATALLLCAERADSYEGTEH